jgi:hypothetical protein
MSNNTDGWEFIQREVSKVWDSLNTNFNETSTNDLGVCNWDLRSYKEKKVQALGFMDSDPNTYSATLSKNSEPWLFNLSNGEDDVHLPEWYWN